MENSTSTPQNLALTVMNLQRELKTVRDQQEMTKTKLETISKLINHATDFASMCNQWSLSQISDFEYTQALIVVLKEEKDQAQIIHSQGPDSISLIPNKISIAQYTLLKNANAGYFNTPSEDEISQVIYSFTNLPRLLWCVNRPHKDHTFLFAAGFDMRTMELFQPLTDDNYNIFTMIVRYLELLSSSSFRIQELEHEKINLSDQNGELKLANQNLQNQIIQHLQTQQELANYQSQLEGQIKGRDAALEKIQSQLLESSRQAEMAEIATNVLHNVSNVLNSVNIDAAVIRETLKDSNIPNLQRLVTLIQENNNNLGSFFTEDNKGKLIPKYLENLSQVLLEEQNQITKHSIRLKRNINQVINIITAQQSYAHYGGAVEICQLSEIVEDAIQINEESFRCYQIEIIREFTQLPAIYVDKHKVIQILINLFSNAKQAMDGVNRTERIIRVKISKKDEQIAFINISDNGIGIPKENLTQIFDHGFTTRKNGHGFGLHSAAITAQELGGDLLVSSEGVDKGAQFSLEIPMRFNKIPVKLKNN